MIWSHYRVFIRRSQRLVSQIVFSFWICEIAKFLSLYQTQTLENYSNFTPHCVLIAFAFTLIDVHLSLCHYAMDVACTSDASPNHDEKFSDDKRSSLFHHKTFAYLIFVLLLSFVWNYVILGSNLQISFGHYILKRKFLLKNVDLRPGYSFIQLVKSKIGSIVLC